MLKRFRTIFSDQVKSVARKLGMYVSRFPPPQSKERLLQDFLMQSRINCVLDVGGFVGQYVLDLRKLGYKGRVISFEPVSDSFEKMSAKLRTDPAWSGQLYGLSDRSRDALMYTYEAGDFNSLLLLKEDAETAYSLDHTKRAKTKIKLRRLDEVLPEFLKDIGAPRVFLKMDTQGHDMNVLRGAAGVQKWIVGIQSEVPVVALYEGMPSITHILDFYRGRGFVPIGLYPVSTIASKQVSPEFDVIFNAFDGHLASTAAAGD
jgi:FkbM family methyltransferase